MKFLKKSISIFLCILLLASTLFAESAYAIESDGLTYDIEDGSLVISGNGEMLKTYKDDTTLTEVYILNGVTSIPSEAFSGCTNLQKVVMYNTVTALGDSAFKGCSSLSQVKLSRNIVEIGESAFEGCTSLPDVKIPDYTVTIGKNAFKDCSSLDYVIIMDQVKTIGNGAFSGCSALTKAYYAGLTTNYKFVQKEKDVFGTAKIMYLSPNILVTKTVENNTIAIRLSYVSGGLGAIDGQFVPSGDITLSKLHFLRNTTYSSNSKEGKFAVVDSNKVIKTGSEIVTITYEFGSCEDFSVQIFINSCSTMAGTYNVQVPVAINGQIVTLKHQYDDETSTDPSPEADGNVHATCSVCGHTKNVDLPFIFKNCEMSESTAIIPEYQLSENNFRANYLKYDFPVVTGAYGEFIGTGSTVKAEYDGGITYDYDVAVVGDTDKDGLCDARDAVIIMCINEGLLDADALENCVKIAADANSDKSIDENDSLLAIAKGIALQ